MVLPINVRVASWLGSKCLEHFAMVNCLNDSRIKDYCLHISNLVYTNDVPNWDDQSMKLDITGLGDPLPSDLKLVDHLDEIIDLVREISAIQIYGKYKPEEVTRCLKKVITLSKMDLSDFNLKEMSSISVAPEGWGPSLTEDIVKRFYK